MHTLLDEEQIKNSIHRLAHQLLEKYTANQQISIIGIEPRGVFLSNRILNYLKKLKTNLKFEYGKLDITFYRDDIRQSLHMPNKTDILFSLDNKKVVLIDDVLYTGRTIRAALDALMDFGRPQKIELMVLIDRKDLREIPIQPDYFIKAVDTLADQKVLVHWKEKHGIDEVILK